MPYRPSTLRLEKRPIVNPAAGTRVVEVTPGSRRVAHQPIVKTRRTKPAASAPDGNGNRIHQIKNPKGFFTAAERRTLLARLFSRAREEKSSHEFIELLRFVSRFRCYSLYNRALIFFQCRHASYVAGRQQWKARHGRAVKAGQRGIWILVPFGSGVSFQMKQVFDVSQTEGKPIPKRAAEPFPVSGELQARWLERLLDFTLGLGIDLRFEQQSAVKAGDVISNSIRLLPDADGVQQCIPDESKIEIALNSDLEPRSHFATLIHELAHLLLGHLGENQRRQIPDRHSLPTNVKELEAESVASLVTSEFGLDIYSEKYLVWYRPQDAHLIGESNVIFAAGRLVRVIKGGYKQPKKRAASNERIAESGAQADVFAAEMPAS